MIDLANRLCDFGDTTVTVGALDLVLSLDVFVLHLTGATAKPAWGLIFRPTGFLFQTERDENPWHPMRRLGRQLEPQEWATMISRVGTDLVALSDDG